MVDSFHEIQNMVVLGSKDGFSKHRIFRFILHGPKLEIELVADCPNPVHLDLVTQDIKMLDCTV